MGTLYFTSPNGDGDRHFTWSSEPGEGPAARRAKEVSSFLSYFKTPSMGPTLGIEPATSLSAVKRSTDWANPAAVEGAIESARIHGMSVLSGSYY